MLSFCGVDDVFIRETETTEYLYLSVSLVYFASCSCITPVSASDFTWPSSVCMMNFFTFIRTQSLDSCGLGFTLIQYGCILSRLYLCDRCIGYIDIYIGYICHIYIGYVICIYKIIIYIGCICRNKYVGYNIHI